ncbi:dienelactone hydrolase family protein [Guyparkeria sp.]|uniref:dienelactone hydrolase family protein n=1 Tax=Guyparkeria sp. TaxID=2035736 RepID=UPI003970CD73
MNEQGRIETFEVGIETPDGTLPGDLNIPEGARAIVLFAHGSGSSRLSTRNRYVAEVLNAGGLATLLFDLLTPREHEIDQFTTEYRFDIGLLTGRLRDAVDWAHEQPRLQDMSIGLFGASTGAAAALNVAAERSEAVSAVVSRGGRPDLADPRTLARVTADTLLIVGGLDGPVIGMNREAAEQMPELPRIEIIPGATHLFEEPGKLDEVAEMARDWFREHL